MMLCSKTSKECKFTTLILIILLIIWMIILAPTSIYFISKAENYFISQIKKSLLLNGSDSNLLTHANLAYTLHKTYSTLSRSADPKYPLYFNLEKERLEKLYDTIRGKKKVKKFLIYGRRRVFTPMDFSYCHANECEVISGMERWQEADGLVLTNQELPNGIRPSGQLWFTLMHESPLNLAVADSLQNEVNFTISFRLDSTIYSSYGYYEPYIKAHGPQTRYPLSPRNFAAGRTKKVAWFVSNCLPKSPRMRYAKELSRHIPVDIYGACGSMSCPKNIETYSSTRECLKMIRENYKFYLSFENSLCPDYITEKLYKNALRNEILPIVMGASLEEYKEVTPPYSFIHVDQFESPAKLAEYLKYLDRNDTAYNEYFAWHGHGIIHDWDSQPQCAMCLLAHTSPLFGPYWVPQVARWWNDGCNGRRLRWNPEDNSCPAVFIVVHVNNESQHFQTLTLCNHSPSLSEKHDTMTYIIH
uniref:Fucosyltransferase n=1 Tax=Trichobilharzia regenti TaxID=157069 RepID=A0AA85KQS7_TRIRE|nr:unnamed protein product [Trichobilharzia regenti]